MKVENIQILAIVIASISASIALMTALPKLARWIISKYNQRLLNKNLSPYFSPYDVDRATRYYVPTKFQNISPSADEEPGKSHLASAKQLLMPMFLDKAFKDNRDQTKYYLILADSGMGKTTFLINLFLTYINKPSKFLFSLNEKQNIKLFPLGSPDIWTKIEAIENKRDTILLLDAFDEDVKALDNYDARMKEILKVVKEFKQIVITCRTQFFPSDKEVPDETGDVTFGDGQVNYKFQRVYLSVFDESDVKKYLKKRFSIFQRSKRKRAFEIVKKSPNLVMRPMLLSYINDLVEADRDFKYSYEVYKVLIEKWIERESRKHGIRQKYGSEENYRELLCNFSQTLAINLYEKRDERGGYFITKKDFIKDSNGLQISDVDIYGMTETEVRSKSLLNRNAEGQYKFSHKSIFEYFLAKELIQNGKFLSTFDFEGMSGAEKFLDEMIRPYRDLIGVFEINKDELQLSITDQLFYASDDRVSRSFIHLRAKNINKIKLIRVRNPNKLNFLRLSIFTEIEKLIVTHEQNYSLLYDLYLLFIRHRELFKLLERAKEITQMSWRERRESIPENVKKELGERIEKANLEKIKEMIERLQRLDLPELSERFKMLNQSEAELIVVNRLSGYYESLQLKELFKKSDDEIIKTLQPIEDFLKDMKLLQEKLPNCEMIY